MMNSWLARLFVHSCVRCHSPCWSPVCSRCLAIPATSWTTPGGLQVLSLGLYAETPGTFVQALKFSQETIMAVHLGHAMAGIVPRKWRTCVLIPAPLHPERLAERGYNQSALLARAVGMKACMKIEFDWLFRQKQTQAQARLEAWERQVNTKNAFFAPTAVRGMRVLLVDDVVTTGNTVDACAQALIVAGASVEGILACALAPAARRDTREH